MRNQVLALALLFTPLQAAVFGLSGQAAPRLEAPASPPHVWSRSEFVLDSVPTAANPYDPDSIAVDVTFTSHSGRAITMPAFWYQPYTRALVSQPGPADPKSGAPTTLQVEKLTPAGDPGWRVRWTPLEPGKYGCMVSVVQNGALVVAQQAPIVVGPALPEARGFVHVEPSARRFFETGDGRPLPLIGENACYPHARQTYDYDDWLPRMQRAGMNYTRLWMWQWTLGIEDFPADRLHYNQEHAWDLDYILDQGAARGIYVMLCLDYHGALQTRPDASNANNFWPHHAYNQANGGPCATPDDFMTDPTAKALYRKRLRYLIARYGADTSLMSWELFNEIDNDKNVLKSTDVVAWHAEMSRYLHDHDPYRHPVSTSLGSAVEDTALWNIPTLDYTMYHWYATWPGAYYHPAEMAADVASRYHRDFDKPFYIAEFGTSGVGSETQDPYHRGLRQALWAGIISGSAGTSIQWWWEQTDKENLYPLWKSVHDFLEGTGFGEAAWHPGSVTTPAEPKDLGDAVLGGQPFDETILLAKQWAAQSSDPVVIRQPGDSDGFQPFGYIHGHSKPALVSPLKISVRTGSNAHLVMQLNSVSDDAVLAVSANGVEIFRKAYPNLDGKWLIDNEYNQDIDVPLPAGAQSIEIYNPGGDWAYLDWVKIEGALPSRPAQPEGVPVHAWAMTDGKKALIWVLDPRYDWPNRAKAEAETLVGSYADVHGLQDGRYEVAWWDTAGGKPAARQTAVSRGGMMRVPIMPFQVDIAARITPLH